MKNLILLLCNILFVFLSVTIRGQEDNRVVAKIEYDAVEEQLKIKALVTNHTPTYQELNYLLISIKKGESGNLSTNRQNGKFSVNPNESKTLSEINVNLNKNDAVKAFLYIRDEQTQVLLAKDSLEINQDFFQKTVALVESEEASELSGLTIDETKSKTGRDFYDLFYIQYSQLPDKSSAAIIITELPARGSNGQINIKIEDRVVYSFMTNPNEDFLREQLEFTLRYIKEYNNRKKLIKNEFIY